MSDDDDDDYVVPSGTRRSSYVPPTEGGEYVPTLPSVPDESAPTSSTGPVPSIGSAGDDHVAQTPSFAESVEVPTVPAEPPAPIVIEIPAETEVESSESRDQFGLPLVGEPIDIPQLVVTDPLPDAVPGMGTGTVLDDNRLFPPIVTGAADAENVPVPDEEPVGGTAREIPTRKSLTPLELADVLGANGGMSSNDQMALLDAQIPLREEDAAAVRSFVASLASRPFEDSTAVLSEARERFGDLVPELFEPTAYDTTTTEYVDESTPITGVPVVPDEEPVEESVSFEIESAEDSLTDNEHNDVSAAPPSPRGTDPEDARVDSQSWSLAAPAEIVSEQPEVVERTRWWSFTAVVAALSSVFAIAVGLITAHTGGAPSVAFVVAGLAVGVVLVELARRTASRNGWSWRIALEEVFGRLAGRIVAVIAALLVLDVLAVATSVSLTGFGAQLESSFIGAQLTTLVPSGTVATVFAAVLMFGGALVAALPHRWFRAIALTLAGWVAVGTSTVVLMGATLLVLAPSETTPTMKANLLAGGFSSALVISLVLAAMWGFQEVSRVRERNSGRVWVFVGLGLGAVSLAATVTAALLASEGDHFFFGNNPVIHIIAATPLLNVVLGAVALIPAVLFVAVLVFRFIGTATTRDDRADPQPAFVWSMLLIPIGWGVIAYLGFVPTLVENAPSVAVLAIPLCAVVGVLAARGLSVRAMQSGKARVGLLVVAVLATVVGLGYASSDATYFSWIGFINGALNSVGYGVLYVDALAAPLTALLSFLLALTIVLPATRRLSRVA